MTILKRSSRKHWCNEDIALLKKFAAEGISFIKMDIPGRSSIAISAKASDLKISIAKWSDEEFEELKSKFESGIDLSDIKIVNSVTGKARSGASIRLIAIRRGLVEKNEPRKPWTKFEKQTLRRLYTLFTATEIKGQGFFGPDSVDAKERPLPERSHNSISKMIERLKLTDKTKGEIIRTAKLRMTPELSKQLNDYIKANCRKVPTRVIAEIFGVDISTVQRRRTKLGIKMTWQDSMALPGSKAKSSEFAEARKENAKRSRQTRREREAFNL